jgi:hypothetical protein
MVGYLAVLRVGYLVVLKADYLVALKVVQTAERWVD